MIAAPILYAVSISFMRPSEVMSRNCICFPNGCTYRKLRDDGKADQYLSFYAELLLVAFISSAVRIITSSLAAFSFAFLISKGKTFCFSWC